jgi:hypothetical protein
MSLYGLEPNQNPISKQLIVVVLWCCGIYVKVVRVGSSIAAPPNYMGSPETVAITQPRESCSLSGST